MIETYLIILVGVTAVVLIGITLNKLEDEGMAELDKESELDRKEDPTDYYWCPGCGKDWNGAFNSDRRCVTCGRYVLERQDDA